MNLLTILSQPYIIITVLALLIIVITYFIISNHNNKEKNDDNKYNIPLTLLYTFVITLIVLITLKFGLEYMNKNNFFQKGGNVTFDSSDRLTIVADDIDTSLFDSN